jgi:FAD/FMN-containing dehydrogenase
VIASVGTQLRTLRRDKARLCLSGFFVTLPEAATGLNKLAARVFLSPPAIKRAAQLWECAKRNQVKIGAEMTMLEHVTSWGRLGVHDHVVVEPHFLDRVQAALLERGPILGFGLGRSYGDVCLNSGGRLLRTRALDRLINADWTTGIVRAEAGLTFDELLRLTVPKGWFLPVVPGTKFVTLGGAVANDVHGKNHETAGTFGCHVRRLGLSRSSGEVVELAPNQNSEFFAATIGGLGLTGIILWVEVALVRIGSAYVDVETLELADLDGFFRLAEQSQDWEFTVAWVDCLAKGAAIGRGLFTRAKWHKSGGLEPHRRPRLGMPLDAPPWLLTSATLRLFNQAYRARPWALGRRTIHYDPFFFPLDAVAGWNRFYGPRGFFQHQCVVPTSSAPDAMRRLLDLTATFGQGSFLTVLKMFGDRPSPGVLSFPRLGATLALDLPNGGESTRRLLDALTIVVMDNGGRLYPAKDATMSAKAFRSGYPEWQKVETLRDPNIMSDFWRRVAA